MRLNRVRAAKSELFARHQLAMILSVRSQRDLQVASILFCETEMGIQHVNIMFQLQAVEVNVMTGGNCHVMSEQRVTIVCEMSLIITSSSIT